MQSDSFPLLLDFLKTKYANNADKKKAALCNFAISFDVKQKRGTNESVI